MENDQIDTLDHIGFFSAPQSSGGDVLALLDDANAPLGARARSYLHVNCSGCHRPDGPGRSVADLRRDMPDTMVCNVDPQEGDLGISGAKLLVPGNRDQSLLYVRARRRDSAGMPPLASSLIDEEGTALLGDWIDSLTDCP